MHETERTFYYSPREGKWGTGNRGQLVGKPRDWCMIDNLLFCLSRNGTIFWCEPDELDLHGTERVMNTEEVKGLSSLNQYLFLSKIVHFGDQILDRWEQKRMIMHGMATLKMSKYGLIDKFEGLHPGGRMCSSGGNIVLFWDRPKSGYLHIWSAEISLERLQGGEIWGNIEWSNIVMPADESFQEPKKVLHSVSVTL